jgi:hypothetical protein
VASRTKKRAKLNTLFKHKSVCVSAVQQKQLQQQQQQQASPSRSKNQTTSHEPSKSEYTAAKFASIFYLGLLP